MEENYGRGRIQSKKMNTNSLKVVFEISNSERPLQESFPQDKLRSDVTTVEDDQRLDWIVLPQRNALSSRF